MTTVPAGLTELCECLVCFKTDGDPKKLPCGHTCCAGCLQSILDNAVGNTIRNGQTPSQEIACPLCRMPVILPEGKSDNLPTCLLVKQLQGMVGSMSDVNIEPCEICKQEGCKADMICKDCKTGMCMICVEKHKKRQIFANHTVVAKALAVCNLHDNQFLFFCNDCNKLLCMTCLNDGRCEEHKVMSIEVIIPMKRKDIDNLLAVSSYDIEYIKSNIPTEQHIKSKFNMAEDMRKEINDHTDYLIKTIELKRQMLLDNVDQWQQDIENTFFSNETLKIFEKLRGSVCAIKLQSDELILLAIPVIKAKFPKLSIHRSIDALNTSIKFEKLNTIDVGKLMVQFTCELDLSKEPILKWQKQDVQNGRSVHFLNDGSFAFCEYDSQNVKKYSPYGQLLAMSQQQNVTFQGHPVSMTYDSRNCELIIADESKRLTSLNADNLILTGIIDLEDGCKAKDVAILPDATLLVLHKDGFNHYTRQGKLLTKVLKYGSKQFKTTCVQFIDIVYPGLIIVSSINPAQLIIFNLHIPDKVLSDKYLKTMDMRACGQPGEACSTQGNVMVPCSSVSKMPCILQLFGETDLQIKSTLVLPFTDDDHTQHGSLLSVAVRGSRLVVLFQKCLRLYYLNVK